MPPPPPQPTARRTRPQSRNYQEQEAPPRPSGPAESARVPSLHNHRNEGEHGERRERGHELRREHRIGIEREPAIAAASRDAGVIRALLRHDRAFQDRKSTRLNS